MLANNQNRIHKYKYLCLKYEKVREDITFNKICLSKNITPNYVQITIKSTTQAALKTLETANKIWIKEEIKSLYIKRNLIAIKMKEEENILKSNLNSQDVDQIYRYITNWIQPIIQMKKTTQKRKVANLISLQNPNISFDCVSQLPKFYKKTINLTNIEFDKEEYEILDKALKYNINLDSKMFTTKTDLLNFEMNIRYHNKETQEEIRNNFIHELRKTNVNTCNLANNKGNYKIKNEMKTINIISNKLIEKQALILKADKGYSTVVMYKDDYCTKVEEFIAQNEFKKLLKNPTQEFTKEANTAISKCKSITKIEQTKLKVNNPKAPTLRGQPKIHKPNNPIRPIVNFQNAPTYNICKYLNKKIKTSLVWNQTYSLQNTYELIDKIQNIQIPNKSIFISFDITNMYSNIPIAETLQILHKDLSENVLIDKQDIDDIMKLTKTTLKQSYFQYESNYYIQKDGLAMGSPLSGLLADIFMHNLETTKIMNNSNPFKKNIMYWHRYVDDIICLFEGNETESQNFLDFLNSLSNKIKFTIEVQPEKINFLDLTISKEKEKHNFKIFRKETQTDLIIPSKSNHPWQQKMTALHALINRLIRIPMNEIDYKEEINIIKHLAAVNGYNTKTIDKIIQKTKQRILNKNTANKEEKERPKFITVPFNTKFNKAIRKTFDKSTYKVAYKTNNNTFNLINNIIHNGNRSQIQKKDDYSKAGVYKIQCSDCECFYVGKTKRTFQTRFKEHIQAFKSNNLTTMKSNYAEHLLNTNHEYKNINENLEILDYENNNNKLNVKEDFQIYKHYKKDSQNILNSMQLHYKNPIFEYMISLQL